MKTKKKTAKSDNGTSIQRRNFVRGAVALAGASLAIGCKEEKVPAPEKVCPPPTLCPPPPKPPLPENLNPANFHTHNPRPLALETKRSAFGASVITPVSRLFVRNNLPMLDASVVDRANEWKIDVSGVASPRIFSLVELKSLGLDTETTVLQCSGNGRKYFPHKPSGSPWGVGAAGCAIWTGVRLSKVVEFLGGVQKDMKFVTATGGEELPKGVDRDTVVVERSIPIEKGMDDCLLAWELNGAPIPITHGGPLRLIVPGYYGVNNIKYVRRLAFTATQSTAKIQQKGYRVRPLGEGGDPSQPSMWRMNVKSWFNGPGADDTKVLRGKIRFHGVAFSGERGVSGVEFSLDAKKWRPAEFYGPDLGDNAWRQFSAEVDLVPGKYSIYSRATDSAGDVQPEQRMLNERGYGNNSWRDMALSFEVVDELPKFVAPIAADAEPKPLAETGAKQVELSEEAKMGREFFTENALPPCATCHTLSEAKSAGNVGPNLDDLKPALARVESAVVNGVGAMPSYQGSLEPEQIKAVAKYVFESTK